MQHVMIDLETLGTTAGSAILSIGAVKFDLHSNKIDDAGFYASISIDSNLGAGRHISEDTLIWWMQQSPEAQAVFFEPKTTLMAALDDFCIWFDDNTNGRTAGKFIWSNGADFDLPMVAHALAGFDMRPPWDFWDSRCVRTYKNLPGAKDIKADATVKHNALSDAIAQAKQVQAIHARVSTAMAAGHPMIKTAKVTP